MSRERCPQAAAMAGARGAAAAVAVLAAALLVAAGADASGDSLADLGGAAREIESAPGNRLTAQSAAGDLRLVPLLVCRLWAIE